VNARAATVVAGLGAGIAYALVQEIDLRLTSHNVDDLAMLGRPFLRQQRPARRLGLALHLVNSVALAFVYARFHGALPGPPAVRGAAFALIENAVLYPVARLEDHHPGVREGSIARYWTWPAFAQSIPRHLAYGVVLGTASDRLRQPR
jgi:hypothetical protein